MGFFSDLFNEIKSDITFTNTDKAVISFGANITFINRLYSGYYNTPFTERVLEALKEAKTKEEFDELFDPAIDKCEDLEPELEDNIDELSDVIYEIDYKNSDSDYQYSSVLRRAKEWQNLAREKRQNLRETIKQAYDIRAHFLKS